MKLISMTDFVLINWQNHTETKDACKHNTDSLTQIVNYANFLKQPLTLGMFVPCDLEGNVLEEPLHYRSFIDYENDMDDDLPIDVLNICGEYHEAKKRVLFEGFEIKEYQDGDNTPKTIKHEYLHVFWFDYITQIWNKSKGLKTIEDLTAYGLILTPNAIKQLGL